MHAESRAFDQTSKSSKDSYIGDGGNSFGNEQPVAVDTFLESIPYELERI